MADNKTASVTLAALKKLADDELAALRALLAKREVATKRYQAATAALADAEAAVAKAKAEQRSAIDALLAAGMKPTAVAELLGIDERQVRPPRPSRPARRRPRTAEPPAQALSSASQGAPVHLQPRAPVPA